MAHTIHETIEQLHASLQDYIEATYHISAPALIHQRQGLLRKHGIIHQIPYLESTPRYASGETFASMHGLPKAALELFTILSKPDGALPRLVYDPPYKHQSESIRHSLINGRNLVIMTGTGSGKTESFLLPILGKLAREALANPAAFAEQPAMRAMVLYPMNALVNDQLGRLRAMFGDPRLVQLFKSWTGRPPRFARYTSRTPYAGVRSTKKDQTKLKSFGEFYVDIELRCQSEDPQIREEAQTLLRALKERGKWPAKPSIASWYGSKGERWDNKKTGEFLRAVTLPDDSELLTRHEVQVAPPDLLVTNYSMLEYMLMRPIERVIFDSTRAWLHANPDEKFLVVLDEAHLYRGAPGAEVGLLLRRLRDRLDIPPERFQVICATASFNDKGYAPDFGSQLSGIPAETFEAITGELDLKSDSEKGNIQDAELLASLDLEAYYAAKTDADKLAVIDPLLSYRAVAKTGTPEAALHQALSPFPPMARLINSTMTSAIPIAELGNLVFEDATPAATANAAVTVLMALGSIARSDTKVPGLLPCRIHNFFRGLPGLWVCMDPDCSELSADQRNGICGKMYGQSHERCGCGAPVLELYTCRNCGTAYARAYTDDVDSPSWLWPEPGHRLRVRDGDTAPVLPLDILLEEPSEAGVAAKPEMVAYDLDTGQLNPPEGARTRSVYIRGARLDDAVDEEGDSPQRFEERGQFRPCACCGRTASFGRSYVQDHQTKGDQPFQALVARQIQIQPPSAVTATPFAPLQGRKVLAFSDSRQVAARLAPNLQMYSVRDSLRPMIAWGFTRLVSVPSLKKTLCLEDLYLAVLLGAKELVVRLRPETKSGENFSEADELVARAVAKGEPDEGELAELCLELRGEKPPEALLESIVTTIQDKFLGLEALALASFVEKAKHTSAIESLPNIVGIAETGEQKVALVRAWLRCWQSYGFWLNAMPLVWWKRSREEGISVRGHKGKFEAMKTVLQDKAALKTFNEQWLPQLLGMFTQDEGGLRRLKGGELSLDFGSGWARCASCKSVHRPVPNISHCLDCGSADVHALDPNRDEVFQSRKGFYRKPVMEALDRTRQPMALICAEHTAQLNAPQNDDVFSKAEENELLFQDIALPGTPAARATAIDVLSSTTTMEVGIDLGALSGVALRNMPPGRANYQQRAGRAGRRGNAVATVVAFGSADSHDEHYFSQPDAMIRGDVIDPKLTLNNLDIIRRHVLAFLLQRYHQDRLPLVDASGRNDLFSVLGSVTEFRDPSNVLNRENFQDWLEANEEALKERITGWIPSELVTADRNKLLDNLVPEALEALDEAIKLGPDESSSPDVAADDDEEEVSEEPSELGEERPRRTSGPRKLLDRLLYCGALPRYAFPTDVATFHVFDRERSTPYRPIFRFAPSQGLPIALTQYAPGKQVWISNKCYTSGAIYSPMSDDRFNAWDRKQIYMECRNCGFARTFPLGDVQRGDTRDCDACGGNDTFGPARYWLRPPGFAHPENEQEVTSPDDVPETSYATRAKLTMGTRDDDDWLKINDRIRVLRTRQHLLVSNTGPKHEGYTYCTLCGRIEASNDPSPTLAAPHPKPFPTKDDEKICPGTGASRHIVLGTDFITDIALFSMRVDEPIILRPGHSPTAVALRTVSEALAKAACEMLDIEQGELMAEFRPALTEEGIRGREAEIFLYDTLPGGAGFASQLPERGLELFDRALELLKECPEGCDASCYRCLRSFKNKFEHGLLDRHIGVALVEYLLSSDIPRFNSSRIESSLRVLAHDLQRQPDDSMQYETDVALNTKIGTICAPIVATNAVGKKSVIALSAPLSDDYPDDPKLAELMESGEFPVVLENELVVRRNLSFASREVRTKLR